MTTDIFDFDLSYSGYVTMECSIDGSMHSFSFLIDSQADVCILKRSSIFSDFNFDSAQTINIRGITHDSLRSLGVKAVGIHFSDDIVVHDFHIVPDAFNIDSDGIIGKDFLVAYRCNIDYSKMIFSVPTKRRCANVLKLSNSSGDDMFVIPPRCEVIRQFKVNSTSDCVIDQLALAEGVYTARTIVNPQHAFVRVVNTTNEPKRIPVHIQQFEPIENFDVYNPGNVSQDSDRTSKLKEILSGNVPSQYREQLFDLIDEFTDVFAMPDDRMSVNNFYSQKLRLMDQSPSYIRNYRTPHVHKEEIQRQVKSLLDNDLIEPCASNFNSPLILVPKKSTDGSRKWRMCLDFRSVNRKLIADKFPLPRIDDILDNLGRSVVFSVMDLFNGFHQVPLDESSRDVTAFSTDQGSFRWKVLPFGLNVSPNSFSRMMHLAFSGLPADKLFIYIDDIIVLGKSERDHLENLRTTFQRCRDRNLKINPSKCNFFRTEVLFLGHLCTSKGIRPDPSKFSAISDYPTPTNSDAVRRFVAMANYYRKFIPKFSVIAIPLNSLTRKNAQFLWTIEHEQAFNRIKQSLANPELLAYPDFSKQFVLTVDASGAGVGSVLSQDDRPIAFASKGFTKAERNKATIEQELIAIHWSIRHFRHYLYGTHFIVRSDHRPLVYLYNLRETSSKLTRLRLELAEFNFTVEHIKGKNNVVADALSRVHIDDIKARATDSRNQMVGNERVFVTTRSMTRKKKAAELGDPGGTDNPQTAITEPSIAHEVYRSRSKGIPIIHTRLIVDTGANRKSYHGQIGQCNQSRFPNDYIISVHEKYRAGRVLFEVRIPFVEEVSFTKRLLSELNNKADELGVNRMRLFVNEEIFREISINKFKEIGNATHMLKNLKIVLLDPLRNVTNAKEKEELIKRYHEDPIIGGHLGVRKVLSRLRANYTWKGMSRQVKRYIGSCGKCQMNKPRRKTVEEMMVTDTPEKPFSKVSIDTIGPLRESSNGNRYVLSMMCELSKYVIMAPIPAKDAKTVARCIFRNLVLVHGPIMTLMTDQGTEFVNSVLRELCNSLNISHVTSTPYHHETMGGVERSHRVFNEYLRSYLSEDMDWEEYLPYFSYCYNTSYHSSFDYNLTPFELVYARTPISPEYLRSYRTDPIYNIEDFAKESKYRWQEASRAAHELLIKNKIKSKLSLSGNLNPIDVKLGDKVLLIDETRRKHDPIFTGPYTVTQINHPNVTIVDEQSKSTKTVHKNRIAEFRS